MDKYSEAGAVSTPKPNLCVFVCLVRSVMDLRPGIGPNPATPGNIAYETLSARSLANRSIGINSRLDLIAKAITDNDDTTLTAQLNLRCRELRGMHSPGLKEYKVDITSLKSYKRGDDINLWTDSKHCSRRFGKHPVLPRSTSTRGSCSD